MPNLRRGLVLAPLLFVVGCWSNNPRVVLYCAQDQEFAEASLREFTKKTGLTVDAKTDTEATKSVSLFTEITQDKDRPRCDVFWNNEILSTIRLQKMGLLEPYASPSAQAYPAFSKTADHAW